MKHFIILSLLALTVTSQACLQDHVPVTHLLLQPDAAVGKDALVTSGNPFVAYGNTQDLLVSAWDPNSTVSRSLIQFDLSSIPENTTIKDAFLTFYFNPTSVYHNPNENLPSGHYGENSFFVRKTTSAWDEQSVTWTTQPTSTTVNQVLVPKFTSPTQDYVIDVTNLVQDMVNNKAENFGFFILHQTETRYRLTFLSSSDHPDAALHPKLEVNYTIK